jgi:hypothetical protein
MATAVRSSEQMRGTLMLDAGCSAWKTYMRTPSALNLTAPRHLRAQSVERPVASRMTKTDYFWFTAGALLAWLCVWLLIRFSH